MCFKPVQLKDGNTVPCGHCLECLSQRRNEWSIRLQLHAQSYDRMPLFCTLTYDDVHLPTSVTGKATLQPKDVVDFLKRLRMRYNLQDTDFTYFGCGEYGDEDHSTVGLARPHYHMLFFGFDALYKIYDQSVFLAEDTLSHIWQKGYVDVCVAGYDGIHYVTKYVLKSQDEYFPGVVLPYTMASKGIGKTWLNSEECKRIKRKFDRKSYDAMVDSLPRIDWSTPQHVVESTQHILSILKPYVMDFRVSMVDGTTVPMPRYYRKKVFGSFEDWRMNPLSYFNFVKSLHKRYKYLVQFKEYDQESFETMEVQKQKQREYEIRKRIINKIR